jgi:hypothetical protein
MTDHNNDGYNQIYEHLVEGDEDPVGLVAYALYKQRKRDFIIDCRKVNGRQPSPAQIDVFVRTQFLQGSKESYHEKAQQFLNAYALVHVEREKPLIVANAITGRMEQAALKVEKSGAWYKQLGIGIVSALTWTLILIALAVCLRYAGIDIFSVTNAVAPTL